MTAANPIAIAASIAAVVTALFIAGHAPLIPSTPDGIDSANFTLAIEQYDPRLHQPHPPGYPVHVALARLVSDVYRVLPSTGADGSTFNDAAGLRLWSIISGGLAVYAMAWMAMALGAPASRAGLVAALTAVCPLFWITAMRPLSDVPGLCFSLVAQALALTAWQRAPRLPADSPTTRPLPQRVEYLLIAAGVVAGLAVGVRVQTALLTLPLLAVVTASEARRHGAAIIARVTAAAAVGILAWAIPMMIVVGGPEEYLRLLTTVAADDIDGVEMVATNRGPRLLALALFRSFIVPWNSTILGGAVVLLSVLGVVTLARRNPRALAVVALMALPYLAFHLLFQESASIRYALPLVPASCLIVALGFMPGRTRMTWVTATVLLAACSALSLDAASAYRQSESPVARALRDVRREAAGRRDVPALAYHHAVGRAIRGEQWPTTVLQGEVRYEWLELARYWLDGGTADVWFLADDRRSDLALIDPAARTRVRSYRWPGDVESLLGGAQPQGVSWYRLAPPGWFVMRGWSLTAETHGLAQRDEHAPGTTGILGYVRRRHDAATMMIGGRNVGAPFDTGATIELSIDGRPRAAWVVPPQQPFLQTIQIAPGELLGAGPYATIAIRAWDASGTARRVDVAVETFDVQSSGGAMLGVGGGWHFPELNPETGLSWRWADRRAELRAEGFGRDVELVIRGESPLRYFQTAPRITITAGRTEVAALSPTSDFEWVVPVPASLLSANGGRLVIESTRSFVPDEVHGNGDRRRLALRIYSMEARIRPSSAPPASVVIAPAE